MKKILALVVAFALCFTAIGGCLTTFAAEAAPDAALSIAFGSENLPWQAGETTVTVSGTGYTAYAAQELSVSFPDALVFESITGIDQYDAVGGENYKVVTAEGITTVTLIQETPADTFNVVFNVAYAINNSGKNKTYTVNASAEVGTDADEPVLYTVAAEPASVVHFTQHAAKAAWDSDEANHWHDCVCSEADCELVYEIAAHNFVEGVCDVCGAAEPEVDEECTHVNTTTTTVDATCNTVGSTTVVCDDCGVTVSTEEIPATGEHNWGELEYSVVDGVCYTKHTCGTCSTVETVAEVNNALVKVAGVMASGLALRFRIYKDDVADYTDFVAEFQKDLYTKSVYAGVSETVFVNATPYQSNRWQFEYTGIASYEMASKIYVNIYGQDANGLKVLVSTMEYSFVQFLVDGYANAINDKYRTFYADTAVYGTAAQTYAGYNLNNPLPNTLVPMDKASVLPTTFENATENPSGIELRAVPVFGNNLFMRYRVYKSLVADIDVANLKATVDYVNASGKAQQFTANGADFVTQGSGTKTSWQFEFNDLAAAHLNDVLTIKLYDTSSGSDVEIGSLQYGFQTYAQKNYTSAAASDLTTLCRAAMAYGTSAKNLSS